MEGVQLLAVYAILGIAFYYLPGALRREHAPGGRIGRAKALLHPGLPSPERLLPWACPLPLPAVLSLLKPQRHRRYLDQFVIGQDDAKKILAVAVYSHYRKIDQAARRTTSAAPRATCC